MSTPKLRDPVTFFANDAQDIRRIKSSIERAMEAHRTDLSRTMKQLQFFVESTKVVDGVVELFRGIHDEFRDHISEVPHFWERNEAAARLLTDRFPLQLVIAIASSASDTQLPSAAGAPTPYNSLPQLFAHLSRDWAPAGRSARRALYDTGIIAALHEHGAPLPRDGIAPSVLVPGAGLGRLAAELAVLGYRCAQLRIHIRDRISSSMNKS